MSTPFDVYLAQIAADVKGGKATEYTHRSALEHLLESLAPGVEASSDPKHIKCGAPDFIVEGRHVPLGYVETKDVGEDLDRAEKSEQLKRYRASLHNLILTDYLEFRWYVNGARKLTTRIATTSKGKLTPDAEGVAKATQLFAEFYQTEVPTVGTPKELAQRMAALTQITRDLIVGTLREEGEAEAGEAGVFHRQLNAFRKYLMPQLTPDEFADIYAQTMAYGLFAARVNYPHPNPPPSLRTGEGFSRAQAYVYLPPANPFLRKLFLDVGEELDGTPIAPFLDDLAALLARADMSEILKDFGKRTRTEDPVVHFYETFLAAYNPRLREMRGVYYTPEPVVQFIVSSVDELLRTHLNRPLGLADPDVLLLDPATGTGTFLYFVIRLIHETQMGRGQAGAWQDYVRGRLLGRVFGFELLMAPYAVAHLKLGLLLSTLGYTFGKHERLGVYLTNTLEQGVTHAETLGLAGYLSEEGNAAAEVKGQRPIMVVLGNPPYSNFGMMNRGDWIRQLLEDYKRDLHEKKLNLDDDFIKFIRFGQWRIEQTGQGILAFITNNTYIDGITHRRMRQSLMETFTDIYILNLHGSVKKKETAPDGSKDENVFDIQQGVAISIFVKEPGKAGPARVHYADLWGLRESKYAVLSRTDVATTTWTTLEPKPDYFFFVPKDFNLKDEYSAYPSLKSVFVVSGQGVKTERDRVSIHWTRHGIEVAVADFRKLPESSLRQKYSLGDDSRDWKITNAKLDVLTNTGNGLFRSILYRPFDERYTWYSGQTRGFVGTPGYPTMHHMLTGGNMALLAKRQSKRDPFSYVWSADRIVESCVFESAYANNSVFPLYLYTTPADTAGTLFAQSETTRTPNLTPEFIKVFSEKLGLTFVPDGTGDLKKTFGPEDVFHYMYAVFHSPTYRRRYAEFLKIDFPRLPLTSDRRLFGKLVGYGAELVSLHLLKSPTVDEFVTTFPVSGSNTVERVQYAKRRVWINATQYFGGVPEAVWKFQVGGYQVCEKWLKDRRGRTLSGDDITHYQRVVVALKETMRVMREIDRAIPGWPVE